MYSYLYSLYLIVSYWSIAKFPSCHHRHRTPGARPKGARESFIMLRAAEENMATMFSFRYLPTHTQKHTHTVATLFASQEDFCPGGVRQCKTMQDAFLYTLWIQFGFSFNKVWPFDQVRSRLKSSSSASAVTLLRGTTTVRLPLPELYLVDVYSGTGVIIDTGKHTKEFQNFKNYSNYIEILSK